MEKLKNFPLMIVVISLLLLASTLGAWYITKSTTERETTRLFNDEVNIIESWISNRFELYKTIAYGLQAFWAGSEKVTSEEWDSYIKKLYITERFPGITSIAFAKGEDDTFIVTYVYPAERSKAIGFNIASEEKRLKAIQKATDNDTIAITGKVFLAADQKSGFIMFAPFYKKGLPHNTDQERRKAIEGFGIITFKSEAVFKDLFDIQDPFPHLDFELYKGKVVEDEDLLYDHDQVLYIRKGEDRNRLETKRTLIIDSETFTLLAASKPSFGLRTLEKQLPNIVLILGLAFSFLFFILAFSEFQKRQKKERP